MTPRRALYGRSRGKTLRTYHAGLIAERLPRLEIDPARSIGECRRSVSLRADAKSGWRSALAAASICSRRRAARRDIGFIGCEPFINGVAKALAGIEEEKLDNVRLRAGDAGALIAASAGRRRCRASSSSIPIPGRSAARTSGG